MIYLTGSMQAKHRRALIEAGIGLMAQPGSYGPGEVEEWPIWSADNGCFAAGERFDAGAWLEWLGSCPADSCLFATAPDVVADADATERRSAPYFDKLRSLGYPVAYVAQDGIQYAPWEEINVLFVGGSTAWKLSDEARRIVDEARGHGKWCHMGRVNSLARLRWAHFIGCESVDGTFLKYGPDANLPRLLRMLDQIHQAPPLGF